MLAFDVGAGEITEAMIVVELDAVLFNCVCARASGPELNNEIRARKLMATRMPMQILSPKVGTFKSCSAGC
jgi:hypothetical protein